MAVIAAATTTLRVSAFVFNNDLRHPAVLAQDLASLDILSEGRLDVAIGAGWNEPEYRQTGIPYDPVPVRQERLAEAVTVLKGLFADGEFSFQGKHYTISAMDGAPKPVQRPHPPFMIGGGGRRTLELAGREAQIVSFASRHRGTRSTLESLTSAALREKIEWVRIAAGDRFGTVELGIYPSSVDPTVTAHPDQERDRVAAEMSAQRGEPVTADFLRDAPSVMIDTVEGFVERFTQLREEFGITSFMVGEPGPLDAVVERLAGS
jgi:probable F420-dependent oxidoreductase